MTITALIINWNGQSYIKDTLERITGLSLLSKIIVIENASDDNSAGIISQTFPKIQLVSNTQHLSFTECINYGLTEAFNKGSEYIWLLGSDVLVEENSLKNLVEIADKYKDVGMISSKVFVYPNKDAVIYYAGGIMDWYHLMPTHRGQGQIDAGQFEHDVETDFVLPLSTLINSRVIKEVGLLDPAYFSQYDWLDYCYKLKYHSWRLMYSCQSHVWFRNLQEIELPGTITEYFTVRNQLLFGLRYAPFYTKYSLIKNAFHQYFFGHPWQRRAVLDFFTGNFGRGSYQP
jgi:GT2 family glycosyltransferase